MEKPAFDPSKAFTPASAAPAAGKPAFNPNQAFSPAGAAPAAAENDPTLWQKTKGALGTGLDYGLRALDYAGGLTRTAAAGAISPLTPNGEVVGSDELLRAAKGQAPSSSEYMEKMGVPKGANVDLPLVGNVSARGVGGFVGDVALDPLTYLSFGSSAAAKEAAEKAAARGAGTLTEDGLKEAGHVKIGSPAEAALALPGTAPAPAAAASPDVLDRIKSALSVGGRAAENAGDNLYKSGFKTVDAKLAAKDIDPLSEVMLANGRPAGTAAQMSDAVDKLIADKMTARKAAYDTINQSGQQVDLLKAMQPAVDRGGQILRVNPNAEGAVRDMESWLAKYGKDGQHVPVDLASDYKTSLYNSTLPTSAYAPNGRVAPASTEMQKYFARGLKQEIEAAGERAQPGLGGYIGNLNSDVGTMIAAQGRILPTEVLKGANKNAFTSVDGMIVGAHAASHNPIASIPMLAIKKASDAYNTMAGRTHVGNALSALGRSGVVDPTLRRTLIDMNQDPAEPESPWTRMGK